MLKGNLIIQIVAFDRNRIIGDSKTNSLCWNIPEDMQHFVATTRGHTVIMGRKTFESLGCKALKGRDNIVISRSKNVGCLSPENPVRVASNIGEVRLLLQSRPPVNSKVYVIGGAEIYSMFQPMTDIIIASEIDLESTGDVKYSVLDSGAFVAVQRSPKVSQSGITFNITQYARGD